jgi:hypothetical protein
MQAILGNIAIKLIINWQAIDAGSTVNCQGSDG